MGLQSSSCEPSATPATFFFVCQMSSVFPCCITPPCPLSLSQTLQWSITSNTAICHECLMSHRHRKLFDHMIRHSIKNLVLRQPWTALLFLSVDSICLCFCKLFGWNSLLCFIFYILLNIALLSSAMLSSSFYYPSFSLGAHLSSLTAPSWAGSPTSLHCLKIEN